MLPLALNKAWGSAYFHGEQNVGDLHRWHLPPEFVQRFPIFIETGTGRGDGTAYAATYSFRWLRSIEVWLDLAVAAQKRFEHDRRITIVYVESRHWLPSLLSSYTCQDDGIFLWLDAHYPGGDHAGQPFDAEPDEDVRLPLETELRLIREFRPEGNYCLLIDDLRLYIDDDWQDGPLAREQQILYPKIRNGNILKPFRATHDVHIDRLDGGYALVVPRGVTLPYILGA